MTSILGRLLSAPVPIPWLLQDLLAIVLGLLVLVFVVRLEKRPWLVILEAFAFVFVYASVYENAAVVMGLYSYGRSLVMIGSVPASVPIIEVCVLITGLWFLERTTVPPWAWPPVIGLFGMLQDFSLDPLAIRQVFAAGGTVSGRWNWLIDPGARANILGVPVFNFPGWMLIMLYASTCLLLGRWWFRRSGERALVGIVYPFLSMLGALLLMVSPLSRFLLWLWPVFRPGGSAEWVVLAADLLVPIALLAVLWRGRMCGPFARDDLPIFVVPIALHLSDLAFAIAGRFYGILWIVVVAGLAQTALLLFAWANNRRPARSPDVLAPGRGSARPSEAA